MVLFDKSEKPGSLNAELALKRTVLDYIDQHHTASLATEMDRIPHAATVFYVNIGFDLYFLSSPSSRHGENFTRNPMVSATINEDYSDWLSIKGIQLEGQVELIGGIIENIKLAKEYVSKYPDVTDFLLSPKKLGPKVAQKISRVRFYRLISSVIYYIDNEKGFGSREKLVL